MAFSRVERKSRVVEGAEDFFQTLIVLLDGAAEDQNVVKVTETGPPLEARQGVVHKTLKCAGSALEPEWHDPENVLSVGGREGCLRNVLRCDWDLMET